MDYESLEKEDPFRINNALIDTNSITQYSGKAICVFVVELILLLVAWGQVLSNRGLVMLGAVPLIILNCFAYFVLSVITKRGGPNIRQRGLTSKYFVLAVVIKTCVTVSFLIMVLLVSLSSDYMLQNPGWVLFLTVFLLMFSCYWLMSFYIADRLT